MPKLTARQKLERDFMVLNEVTLTNQRIDLEVKFAREREETRSSAFKAGYGRAVEDFNSMSAWQRLTWKVKK